MLSLIHILTLHVSSLRIILRDNFKGGFFMSEKMLVTQALDERDLLVKKISDKIDKASWITNGGMLGIIIHQG